MEFKEGSGWKACYDEERELYTVETKGGGSYHLYEIDAETYARLGSPELGGRETERLIAGGRHLYADVDDVRSGMPYTRVFDPDYARLCPWARVQDSGHRMPEELTGIGVRLFENDKTKEHWEKQKNNFNEPTGGTDMEHSWKNVPKLGFGLMRLPMLGDEVDIEQFKQMVDAFIAAGFTYFDTAYGYISGKSEAAAKVALVERYPRDSFTLATKLPAWAGPKTAEEAKQMFWTSLERTGAGYFDFYLLHNIGAPRIKAFDDFGIWDFLKERKAEGLIRHLGFSFHDSPEMLDRVLTEHPDMDFVQLQINYADWEDPGIQSKGCWETVRKHNKPVVIMEPVKGGTLANLAPDVRAPFEEAGLDPVAEALRFAASLDGVITVLSGMSTMGQMEQNIATMKDFQPLSEGEKAVIKKARAVLKSRPIVPCTNCRYCVPGCPMSIAIPDIFQARNKDLIFGDRDGALGFYKMVSAGAPASQCVGCGQCEAACPQHIGVIDALKDIAADYDK